MDPSIDFAGWIYKQGSLIKTWRKRYAVLRGNCLFYYDSPNSIAKEKGKLKVLTVERSDEINNGILIHASGGRVMKMYTDSNESCMIWIDALERSVHRQSQDYGEDRYSCVSRQNFKASVAPSITSPPAQEEQKILHRGWLQKEGHRVKNWKRRFFVLAGSTLSYYDSTKRGAKAKGKGQIRNVVLPPDRPLGLDVFFDRGRLLRLSADTTAEVDQWYQVLSNALNGESEHRRPSYASTYRPESFISSTATSQYTEDIVSSSFASQKDAVLPEKVTVPEHYSSEDGSVDLDDYASDQAEYSSDEVADESVDDDGGVWL